MPCNKTVTAIQTADLLVRDIFKCFGLSDSIISDRGVQFTATVFKEVMKALKITQKLSTAFHLQTDGQMECYNQELEVYVSPNILCQ